MDAPTNEQQDLHLDKAYSYFFIPFYFEGDGYEIVPKEELDPVWELSKGKLVKEGDDVLFPYIINFLQGQKDGSADDYSHLEIYNINSNAKSVIRKFWDAFSQKPDNNEKKSKDETGLHFVDLENGKDENNGKLNKRIEFDIVREDGYNGFKSPHLFISPNAHIGILTFCLSLGKKNRTIADLKLFNYYLHKINKPYVKCVTPSFRLVEGQTFYNDEARKAQEDRIEGFRNIIDPYTEGSHSPYDEFDWHIRTLINMMLENVKGFKKEEDKEKNVSDEKNVDKENDKKEKNIYSDVKLFSDIRAHLFSFCQIDGVQNLVGYDDIKHDLMLLSRCFNDKYMLDTDEATEKEMCLRTFNNIYFASSVEGASMIAIAKEENRDFIKQIDSQSLPRYLAVYLLVIIQRYSMLHINRKLTEIESEGNDESLWALLDVVKKVKVHCYFTDVSPYSQHNQFYQHCCRNLHILGIFNEIDNKTKIVNLTVSHSMQKLMEQQKRESEERKEEAARREKVMLDAEKKRENQLRNAERKAESRQRRLSIVVGILTAFQVSYVIYSYAHDSTICYLKYYSFWWALASLVLCCILICIVLIWGKTDNDEQK